MNNDVVKISQGDFTVKTIDAKIDPKLIGAHTHTINAAGPQYNHYAPQPEYEIIGVDFAAHREQLKSELSQADFLKFQGDKVKQIEMEPMPWEAQYEIDKDSIVSVNGPIEWKSIDELVDTSMITSPIADLEKLVEVACSHGHFNYDEYLYGMANGLILALATMKNEEPNYLDRPEQWLCDMYFGRPSLTDDTAKSCPEQEEDLKANGFMSRRFVLRRYLQMSDEEIALANEEIALTTKAIGQEDDLNAQRNMADIIQSCAVQDKPMPKPADADMEEAASLMADKMRDFVDNEILEELKLLGEEQATDNYERSMKGL